MTTKLDTRERRRDMTSRECASILGALLGGLAQIYGVESVRTAVTLAFAVSTRDPPEPTVAEKIVLAQMQPIMTIIGAVYAGLISNALPSAALDTMRWFAEHEDQFGAARLSVMGSMTETILRRSGLHGGSKPS